MSAQTITKIQGRLTRQRGERIQKLRDALWAIAHSRDGSLPDGLRRLAKDAIEVDDGLALSMVDRATADLG